MNVIHLLLQIKQSRPSTALFVHLPTSGSNGKIPFLIQNYTLQISFNYYDFYISWTYSQRGRAHCYCRDAVYRYNSLHITHSN